MDQLSSKRPSRSSTALAAALAGLVMLAGWWLVVRGEALPLRLAGSRWQLAEPGWLVLLSLAVPHLLLRRPGAGTLKRRVLLALRLGWLALAVLALAGPAKERRRAEVSVAALVDVSSSVSGPDLERARAMLVRLEAEAHRHDVTLSVVPFAAFPAEVSPAATGAERARLATARLPGAADDSDLALALGSGLARLEPQRVGRLLLISDGRPTRGELMQAAERARRRGVRVFVHPLSGGLPAEPDVALASLTGPGTIRPGESFELEARVVATRPGSARLRLTRDGQPAGLDSDRTVTLSSGVGLVRFTTRLAGEAPALYRLEVAGGAEDREPRNDAIVLAVAPESRPRVLVAESSAGSTQAFRRALAAEQIDVQATVGLKLPDPARLEELDLVVLSDLQAWATPAWPRSSGSCASRGAGSSSPDPGRDRAGRASNRCCRWPTIRPSRRKRPLWRSVSSSTARAR